MNCSWKCCMTFDCLGEVSLVIIAQCAKQKKKKFERNGITPLYGKQSKRVSSAYLTSGFFRFVNIQRLQNMTRYQMFKHCQVYCQEQILFFLFFRPLIYKRSANEWEKENHITLHRLPHKPLLLLPLPLLDSSVIELYVAKCYCNTNEMWVEYSLCK